MTLCAKQSVPLFLTCLFALCAAATQQAPDVHTKLGSLRGQYLNVKGKETGVYAYLGIPFAKPPLGPSLRLAAPQPAEAWEGLRDATQQPPMCMQNKQFSVMFLESLGFSKPHVPDVSEDCLYLNIYTPAKRSHDTKLPVMVWIHGGAYAIGSASSYDGSALAAYQDVVVVLIQYRLGILGFLSTGDEHMSGNFGLLDQIQALRWTQEHIHNFGGNPNAVTIFGESAGGVSVSLLLLSPLSKGLFHNAIAESGNAAMYFLVANDPLPAAKMVANMSGCSLESTEKIASCMKNIDNEAIMTHLENTDMKITVNVDGHFLQKPVDELFRNYELLNLPFMTGVNNDEGGWLLANYFAPPNWTEGMDREDIVNMLSIFYPRPEDAHFKKLVVDGYVGTGEDRLKNRQSYTQLLGDLMFVVPAIKAANAHRDAGAPVYLYEYQHPPKFMEDKRPSFVKSDHADDIFTVFGFCFIETHTEIVNNCSEEEEQLSRTMMSYWGNFAYTGSPNGRGLVHWPKYGAKEEYMEIRSAEQVVSQGLKKDQFALLTQTRSETLGETTDKERSEL